MPHLSTQEVEDVVATTLEYRIPTVVDNFYLAKADWPLVA